jgi:hypothetical protein
LITTEELKDEIIGMQKGGDCNDGYSNEYEEAIQSFDGGVLNN